MLKSENLTLFLLSAAILSLGAQEACAAEASMQAISGADRSFTYGYSQAREVQRFEQIVLQRNAQEAAEPQPVAEIETEPLRFYKSFRVATLYDSNIFDDTNDPKGDQLMLYTPSVGLAVGKAGVTRGYLNAFYDLTYVNYAENSKFSRFNQAQTVDMGFKTAKFDFHFANKFQPASARETGERTELSTGNGNRVVAWSDNADFNTVYHWTAKTDLSADYTYEYFYLPGSSNANNPGVTLYSFQQNGIAPRISYKLTSKDTIYAGGGITSSDYFKNGGLSSKSYDLLTGVWHRFSPKTDLRVEAGYDWRDYNLPLYLSSEGPELSAILRHQFSQKIVATLSARRSLSEAFDYFSASGDSGSVSTKATLDNYRVDVDYQMTPSMSVGGYMGIEVENRPGLYTFSDPENSSLTFTRSLEDQAYDWGLTWGWRPGGVWSFLLGYESLTNFSSFKNLEYDEQRVGCSARRFF